MADAPTPLTNSQEWPTGDTGAYVVHSAFARSLERRVAELEAGLRWIMDRVNQRSGASVSDDVYEKARDLLENRDGS